MYRLSKNIRKYSTTPIVKVITDDSGKEQEQIVCLIPLPKKDGEALADKIIHLLNINDYIKETL